MAGTAVLPKQSAYRRYAWSFAAAAAAVGGGYVVYKVFLQDSVEKTLAAAGKRVEKALSLYYAVSEVSDLSRTLAKDLKDFLESDADEPPRTVKQLLKLSRCPEFQEALLKTTCTVAEGAVRGFHGVNQDEARLVAEGAEGRSPLAGGEEGFHVVSGGRAAFGKNGFAGSAGGSSGQGRDLVDRLLTKMFSDEGRVLASAVAARAVRTLVLTLNSIPATPGLPPHAPPRVSTDPCSSSGLLHTVKSGVPSSDHLQQQQQPQQQPQQQFSWLRMCLDHFSTEAGRRLLTDCVSAFAVHSVGTFLDKTGHVNMYDDILVAVSRHEPMVRDLSTLIISTVVREAILGATSSFSSSCPSSSSSSSSSPSSSSSSSSSAAAGAASSTTFNSSAPVQGWIQPASTPGAPGTAPQKGSGRTSWQADVGCFLLEPRMRQLLLDITAVVTAKGMETLALVLLSSASGQAHSKHAPGIPLRSHAASAVLRHTRSGKAAAKAVSDVEVSASGSTGRNGGNADRSHALSLPRLQPAGASSRRPASDDHQHCDDTPSSPRSEGPASDVILPSSMSPSGWAQLVPRVARVCAARALTAASVSLALVLHCSCGMKMS